MMHFMTQQCADLQTSMKDPWTSTREQMQKNHEESTAHINRVQKEMHGNFLYIYNHLHIPPFDPANPAVPLTPVVSLQAMPPQDPSINPSSNFMDLS